jgi:hypothetical protein
LDGTIKAWNGSMANALPVKITKQVLSVWHYRKSIWHPTPFYSLGWIPVTLWCEFGSTATHPLSPSFYFDAAVFHGALRRRQDRYRRTGKYVLHRLRWQIAALQITGDLGI